MHGLGPHPTDRIRRQLRSQRLLLRSQTMTVRFRRTTSFISLWNDLSDIVFVVWDRRVLKAGSVLPYWPNLLA